MKQWKFPAHIYDAETFAEVGVIPTIVLEQWRKNERERNAPLTPEQCRELSEYLQSSVEMGYAFFESDRVYISFKGS